MSVSRKAIISHGTCQYKKLGHILEEQSYHIKMRSDTVGAVVVMDETTVKAPKRDRNGDRMFGPCR